MFTASCGAASIVTRPSSPSMKIRRAPISAAASALSKPIASLISPERLGLHNRSQRQSRRAEMPLAQEEHKSRKRDGDKGKHCTGVVQLLPGIDPALRGQPFRMPQEIARHPHEPFPVFAGIGKRFPQHFLQAITLEQGIEDGPEDEQDRAHPV